MTAAPLAALLAALLAGPPASPPAGPPTVAETAEEVRIETDLLVATVRKRGYVSGVASLKDKRTGRTDVGFGLHIMDFLLAPGWREDGYLRDRRFHGDLPKHYVEGPQICTKARELPVRLFRGAEWVGLELEFRFTQPGTGYRAGSVWRQRLLFRHGWRHFLGAEAITSANDVPELSYRLDMPGHIRHAKADAFAEVYLSHLGRVPATAFLADFAPDERHLYRRTEGKIPRRMIRAYRLTDGPWVAGITLDPADLCEGWCHQRGYVCMIAEFGGRKVKAGETFGAAHAVGFFADLPEMERTADRHHGVRGLAFGPDGWRTLPAPAP